jgi:glycosyltransferase involved in cell wall biosynthesis
MSDCTERHSAALRHGLAGEGQEGMTKEALTEMWVIVPAYNEAAKIRQTLRALTAQTDTGFELLVVDNGSTDDTVAIARAFRAPFPVHVIVEPEKGVGCAVDTGFRHAIAAGATLLARTDADCLPRPGWLAAARAGLTGGAGLMCGRITARRDEHGPAGRAAFRLLVAVAAAFGRLRPAHREQGYRAPYRMHAGNNMAITAELYQACGGMPRRPSPTDRAFLNRVRRSTTAIRHSRAMVVENSTRRLAAYGIVGTAKWYLDRGSGTLTTDPR